MKLTRRWFLGAASVFCGLAATEGLEAVVAPGSKEYHVSPNGSDEHDGSPSRMLKTISAAAARAYPGDIITVHRGVYRERVSPSRGGTSDAKRIVYRAAPGEKAEISGAEVIKEWIKVQDDVWKVVIPNIFFGQFNPYSDLLHGDWFSPMGRKHHTGAVYLNGDWFVEAAQMDDVFKKSEETPLWFGQVRDKDTTIWAQFKGVNPNEQVTEINVRQTVFYPEKTGMNYITVRGFTLRQAATPWAPPTTEQIGLIGPNWSKGWIIENNVVKHSVCSGISLGKYGDEADKKPHAPTAAAYTDTINRALKFGWSGENIGHHIVRNNTISHCEQAGIVGSLGAIFSTVTGNTVHDIHVRQLFAGAEMAGIKFHAAIDVEISGNYIYRNFRGLWLDWMAQGTQVSRNLFYENEKMDLVVEVDHGPFLVENNIFLSPILQICVSQGGAYVHNLFCGDTKLKKFDPRPTPFMKAHSTEIAGLHNNPSGDMRFYNNLFTQAGSLAPYDDAILPMQLGGNVFANSAKPCVHEKSPLLKPNFDTEIKLTETKEGLRLDIALDGQWAVEQRRKKITTALLGTASIPNVPFQRADGTAIDIDMDYSRNARNLDNPFPGPFECPHGGKQSILIQPSPAV